MPEELEIVIGANVDDAKQGINSLSGVINDFAQKGKLSIGVVEQSMAQLRATIKNTTDPAELAKLNAAFKELQRTLNNLKIQGGLETQLGGVSRATRLAHSDLDQMALSLRGIASGSERGIDGLSNLIFTFERLSGVSGGIGNGLAALGESLLGPAGIVLAVTTLLPAVVSLVGELGNSETAAEKNKKAFDDLNVILADSKKAFDELQTKVKFLDEVGPINLDIQFGKGFQTDILDLNAKTLELNDEILKQQEVLNNALNARRAAQNAADDAALAASENATKANKKASEDANKVLQDSIKAEDDANKTLGDLLNQRTLIYRKTAQERTQNQRDADKKANDAAIKQLEEFNKQFAERVKRLADSFNIPIDLKFSVDDTPGQALDKAKKIIQGIEDHEIRLKVIAPDKIELPKLEPEIDKPFFKAQLLDLVKGFQIPLESKLDETTLLESEDKIKSIFSDLGDTSIFTEAGKNAGKKFSDALIKAVEVFQKGFKISPDLNIDDVVNSLTASLEPLQKITLKVLKSEDFKSAITDLERLHDAGVAAGDAAEKAFLKAGFSATDASKGAKAITDSFKGITKEAGDAALVISDSLGSAVTSLIDAFANGKNPAKAFFNSILGSLEQVIGKIIQAQIEQLILNTLFKAASAAFNPLSLLGNIASFFAEGGDPPVNKPSIVGEKGWEIFVPKTAGTIYSHKDSVKMISSMKTSSVKESESIKEYLITTKVSQIIRDHISTVPAMVRDSVRFVVAPIENKLSETVKSITANNDKLTAYSYRLHEVSAKSIQSIKESFKSSDGPVNSISNSNGIFLNQSVELNGILKTFSSSVSGLNLIKSDKFTSSIHDEIKDSNQTHQTHPDPAVHPPFTVEKSESFKTISDSLSKIVSTYTNSIKDSSFRESSSTETKVSLSNSSLNSFIEKLSKSDTLFKDSSVSSSESFNSKETFFNSSSLNDSIEKLRTSSVISDKFGLTTIYDKSKSYEGQSEKTFVNNTSSVRDNSFFDSTNTLRESLKESFSKLLSSHTSQSDKEYFEHIKDIINERGFERTLNELLRESFKESTSDKFNSIKEKSTDRSNDRSTFLNSSTNETSTLKTILSNLSKTTERSKEIIDRMIEKATINSSTEKHNSVHIEKVVNNNFFSDSISSSKELIKSMSVERFGKMFGIPAFAQGGAVFGPTLAILGEGFGISRSNPEFVGTRDQLKGIQGGQFDVNVSVNGDISFDMGKLALALNREERSHIRTNGKKPF